ncbi:CysS/YqeB C-terminal domain-containing protein [Rhodococcus qingshengii]|uniref:CysS/YqeB C-terminal domain-containing protein n=1 Tax=Rhodococcus qingshengii TaxID=334542 RepID=UPI003D2D3A6A
MKHVPRRRDLHPRHCTIRSLRTATTCEIAARTPIRSHGGSGLSQDANAILRARQYALDSGGTDAQQELRDELARHRILVCDSGKYQHWRPLTSPTPDKPTIRTVAAFSIDYGFLTG